MRLRIPILYWLPCAFVIGVATVQPAIAAAEGLDKGSSIVSFQLTRGDGDFVTAVDPAGYISAYDHSEWGVQVQYQRLLSSAWALSLGLGLGFSSETNEPGTAAAPGAEDFEYSQDSWQARIGFDRFAHISPAFHLYAGPGIQYWSGEQERGLSSSQASSPTTSRIGLSGRIGVHVALSETVALNGHLGGYIAHASAEEAGAKASWWPTGNEGAVGLALDF